MGTTKLSSIFCNCTHITECFVMVLVLGMFRIQVELESLVSQLGRVLIELVQEAIWKYVQN